MLSTFAMGAKYETHTKKSLLKDFTRYNYFIHNLFDVIPMVNQVKTNYLQHDLFISFRAFGNLSHCQE